MSDEKLISVAPNALSVSQVIQNIKEAFSTHFPLLSVQGELTALKRHSSGHRYFVLKEGDAILDALCWRHRAFPEDVDLEGSKVVCTGQLMVYGERSKYVFHVQEITRQGQGEALKALQALKAKLRDEGLFDRKKPLPHFPRCIGLITSRTGAVIQDMSTSFMQGFPCQLLLHDTLMQGKNAIESILKAWHFFHALNPAPDLLIIARGGGSMEDLTAFNNELLVRTLAQGKIPFISAIGHETDTTLVDYVADVRVSTPTAAAQRAVPRLSVLSMELEARRKSLENLIKIKMSTLHMRMHTHGQSLERVEQRLNQIRLRLTKTFQHVVSMMTDRMQRCQSKLLRCQTLFPHLAPLASYRQKIDQSWQSFQTAWIENMHEKTRQIEQAAQKLQELSIDRALKRGLILALDQEGKILKTRAEASAALPFVLRFCDGDLEVQAGCLIPPKQVD